MIVMLGIIIFSYSSPDHTMASNNTEVVGGVLLTILIFVIAIVL